VFDKIDKCLLLGTCHQHAIYEHTETFKCGHKYSITLIYFRYYVFFFILDFCLKNKCSRIILIIFFTLLLNIGHIRKCDKICLSFARQYYFSLSKLREKKNTLKLLKFNSLASEFSLQRKCKRECM
jgi:hypothetical protein